MAIIYTKTVITKKITLLLEEKGMSKNDLHAVIFIYWFHKHVADKLILEKRINQLYDEAKENCELVSALISTNKHLRITTLESKQLLDSEKGETLITGPLLCYYNLICFSASHASLNLKCTHLQKEAEISTLVTQKAKSLTEILEHEKAVNSDKEKEIRRLKCKSQ